VTFSLHLKNLFANVDAQNADLERGRRFLVQIAQSEDREGVAGEADGLKQAFQSDCFVFY